MEVDKIDMIKKQISIPTNMAKPEELPLARKYVALHEAGLDSEIPYKAMQLTTVVAEAYRMLALQNGPEEYKLDLSLVTIGSIAMLGIPGEPFTDIGVEIKKAKGWELIMPCSLTNGDLGYYPMKSAYDEGGYEARSSIFKAGVAEIIIEEAKKLLEGSKKI